MRYGLYFPNFGPFGDPAVMVRLARSAEAAGWDGVFPWDHIQAGHWAGPVVDPWVAMAAMAAATERIALGPMICPLPRRRPTKLARETVTLDHLSGGRLVLGVGIGWPPDVDFAAFGDAGDNRVRGEQLDEGLDLLTALWSGEVVDHEGPHYTARNARFLPTPVQRPRIPIWVGGMWPHRPAFRRAARWDGVYPIAVGPDGGFAAMTPALLAEIVSFVRSHRDSDEAFDVAAGGSSYPGQESAPPEEFAGAGATWWMEGLGWPPDIPLEAWEEFVAGGPPR
jgi:alkanesulfonate monooxygenase SsuD/methylene tetrahydromethanopterin reductase-like flavin-dependent oxidoreductase (luciferase family)